MGAALLAASARRNLRLLEGVDGDTDKRTSDAQGRGSSMIPSLALQDAGQRDLPAAGRARGGRSSSSE
jgi:hypothetical protein